MHLLLISFLAGIMTVLAPCVLSVLPIIIGGSVHGGGKRNPYLITTSLAVSIVGFTLLLKFSSLLVNIPASVWNIFSGTILILFGLLSLFSSIWERISHHFGLTNRSEKLLADSAHASPRWSDILIGASLGPVFSSCSPTYFLILATVLPRNLATGVIYLIAYALGLSLVLLLVSLLGQRFIRNAVWASNPRGWFKRSLGILFILVGIFILTGADKRLQALLLEKGYFNVTNLEQRLLQTAEPTLSPSSTQNIVSATTKYPHYKEIQNPSGFVNSDGITLSELIGKKVILVDFMTYTCINCIRTFPYLNAWYDTYKDQGLEIIGIHTPEFAFEKKRENVASAMKRYHITFPIVLDNDYATWSAYENNYWPRKYLIDLDGNIVYDHIGEGKYDETEEKIKELLREKSRREHSDRTIDNTLVNVPTMTTHAQSPETYFGGDRNAYLHNGRAGKTGIQTLHAVAPYLLNSLYLDGMWNVASDHATNKSERSAIIYRYNAKSVFMVARGDKEILAKVTLDGHPIPHGKNGSDITYIGEESFVRFHEERLYSLIELQVNEQGAEEHLLRIDIPSPGLDAYTFTFG